MNEPRMAVARLISAAEDGRLETLCKRFGLDLVSVFGSSLDPSAAAPEDVDVAVRFDGTQGQDFLGVVGALAEMVGSDDLDVLTLNRAGVVARSRALGPRSKGLFESRRGLYALAQMAALSEEMETAPMRRRDLELLAQR